MRDLVSRAKEYANEIASAFRTAWDEHSPSKVAAGLTEMFGAGLEQGMRHWPSVSERLLDDDISRLYTGARQGQAAVSTSNINNNNAVNLNVDRLEVRDQADADALAQQIAGLTRRSQRARGHV